MAQHQTPKARSSGGPRERGRLLSFVGTIVLAALAGAAGPGSAQSTSPAASPDAVPGSARCLSPGLTVVADMDTLTPGLEAAFAGVAAQIGEEPDPTVSILFVVSLLNGPMPPLREQLAAIEGKPHGRAAILLTRRLEVQDDELNALVLTEARELLAAHGQPDADTMPWFLDDDRNLNLLLCGLAASS